MNKDIWHPIYFFKPDLGFFKKIPVTMFMQHFNRMSEKDRPKFKL